MSKRILLIGRNGQVSTYIQSVLKDNADFELVVAGRETIDFNELGKLPDALASYGADIIVNPAAYTAVDLAEEQQELAYNVNQHAVAELAKFCAQSATPLIHFSTDYVFGGDSTAPYQESHQVGPTGVYGASKLAGEQAVLDSGAPAIILRTAWVYSNHGKNFYKTMMALSESHTELSVVADQIGAPTYAGSIAEATKSLLTIIAEQGGIEVEQIGVYHFTCQGQTSWCDFAKALFVENQVTNIKVNPITTQEYPTPAKRPAYSVLDGSKLQQTFNIVLPHWGTALAQCAAETSRTKV